MIIRNKDIVVVGLQPWDSEIGSNCKNIAAELAKYNRVLYVNNPLDRNTIRKHKHLPRIARHIRVVKNKEPNLYQIHEKMWNLLPVRILESINWIPFTLLFRLANYINNYRFASDIKKAVAKLGFRDFILFNDSDMFRSYHLKEMLRPSLSIYYTRDNLMGIPYWRKHGSKMEPELFAKSDIVVANSAYLADLARRHNQHAYDAGQGCDVEDFNLHKVNHVPGDMAGIDSPVIGYLGALISSRLNLALLEKLAAVRKDWNFVLVGPEDEAFKRSVLHRQANVFFPGLKDMKELPAYLSRFDVAINPQLVNEVTIGNYPRKVDEYLAMGKPVVATRTRAMEMFEGYTYFAATAEEYIQQIERALKENTPEKQEQRARFARSHTWENSVAEISKAIRVVRPDWFSEKRMIVG
jgi:teichuronic acid biosynthesis glycosyltransferase TuaH